MTLRYYSSQAVDTTITTASITAGAGSMVVTSTTGWPTSYPFTLALDFGSALEELVDVTNVSGTTVTITRGVDGSTAVGHNVGATIRHVITARDARESNTHVNTSSAVHGLSGTVVGTSDTQTLTNKTINATANTITNIGTSQLGGLGSNVVTFLGTPTSANLAAAVTDEVGNGPLVFGNISFNAQSGTSYTLVASDNGKLVTLSNAAAITLTLPSGVFSTGATINIQQLLAGQVTIANNGTSSFTGTGTKLRTQYSAATIICTDGANSKFTVIGDIA